MPNLKLGAIAALATLALAACSTASTAAPPASSGAPAASSAAPSSAGGGGGAGAVTIIDNAFQPTTLSVKVGDTVTWTDTGSNPHTVTFDQGGQTSDTLSTGKTYSQKFDTAGSFTYHCKIHSSMTATVTVTQ